MMKVIVEFTEQVAVHVNDKKYYPVVGVSEAEFEIHEAHRFFDFNVENDDYSVYVYDPETQQIIEKPEQIVEEPISEEVVADESATTGEQEAAPE